MSGSCAVDPRPAASEEDPLGTNWQNGQLENEAQRTAEGLAAEREGSEDATDRNSTERKIRDDD